MSKKRVHEIAKELKEAHGIELDNKQVVTELQSLGYDVKSHSSSLEDDQAVAAIQKIVDRKKPKAAPAPVAPKGFVVRRKVGEGHTTTVVAPPPHHVEAPPPAPAVVEAPLPPDSHTPVATAVPPANMPPATEVPAAPVAVAPVAPPVTDEAPAAPAPVAAQPAVASTPRASAPRATARASAPRPGAVT
ncbi:MAG: translation initiation factor IF-2 N-terminal domain-containing protein, partial [Myxococcota bacterium]